MSPTPTALPTCGKGRRPEEDLIVFYTHTNTHEIAGKTGSAATSGFARGLWEVGCGVRDIQGHCPCGKNIPFPFAMWTHKLASQR